MQVQFPKFTMQVTCNVQSYLILFRNLPEIAKRKTIKYVSTKAINHKQTAYSHISKSSAYHIHFKQSEVVNSGVISQTLQQAFIQGDSGGMVNFIGGGSMDYSE